MKRAPSSVILLFIVPLGFSLLLSLIPLSTRPIADRHTDLDSRTVDAPSAPAPSVGFAVWRAQNCGACHGLWGAGGGYASDLTHFAARYTDENGMVLIADSAVQGAIRAAIRHDLPADAAPRPMLPRIDVTRAEIEALTVFLASVSASAPDDPPPPRAPLQLALLPTATSSISTPVERGRRLFGGAPANCASCHALVPDSIIVGPSLAGIATVAASRVPGQDAATYIRNAILYPSDYIVEGYPDAMAKNLGGVLNTEQIDDLIAFLLTLELSS